MVDRPNGYAAGLCPACRAATVFEIRTLVRQQTKNLIAVSDEVLGFDARCAICTLQIPIGRDTFHEFCPEPLDLDTLIERTNPRARAAIEAVNRENERLLAGRMPDDDRVEAAARIMAVCLHDAARFRERGLPDAWLTTWIVLTAVSVPAAGIAATFGAAPSWAMWALPGAMAFTSIRSWVGLGRREFHASYLDRMITVLAPWPFTETDLAEAIAGLKRDLHLPGHWLDKRAILLGVRAFRARPGPGPR